jgi:hypothetical protein
MRRSAILAAAVGAAAPLAATAPTVAPAKAPAPSGVVFGGHTAQSWPIVVEVSRNGRQVVRVDVGLQLKCTPSGAALNLRDGFRRLPLSLTGSFKASFTSNPFDVGNGHTAVAISAVKGKLNVARTSGVGTWSLQIVEKDASGATVDTCSSGLVTWKVKQ